MTLPLDPDEWTPEDVTPDNLVKWFLDHPDNPPRSPQQREDLRLYLSLQFRRDPWIDELREAVRTGSTVQIPRFWDAFRSAQETKVLRSFVKSEDDNLDIDPERVEQLVAMALDDPRVREQWTPEMRADLADLVRWRAETDPDWEELVRRGGGGDDDGGASAAPEALPLPSPPPTWTPWEKGLGLAAAAAILLVGFAGGAFLAVRSPAPAVTRLAPDAEPPSSVPGAGQRPPGPGPELAEPDPEPELEARPPEPEPPQEPPRRTRARRAPPAPEPAPAQENGALTVYFAPYGSLWVDGQRIGETPVRELELPPGNHRIGLGRGDTPEVRRTIWVHPGETTTLELSIWGAADDPVPAPPRPEDEEL